MNLKKGALSDYFDGVVVKKLSAVEIAPSASNQHEFNGTSALKKILGTSDRIELPARFIWIGGEQEAISEDGTVTWYDSRRNHPTRTEHRLYYPSNPVTEAAQAGDTLFIARRTDGSLMVIVAAAGATIQSQLLWLFGINHQPELGFEYKEVTDDKDNEIDFATRLILDELGIDAEEPEAARLDELLVGFGGKFPTTREFSQFARGTLKDVSAHDDPDAAVVAWMDREEQLFRRLERHIVHDRLSAGFATDDGADFDVDGFMDFSKSMQQRRRSRAGFALENHLESIFISQGVRYSRGAKTENNFRPDFLFPGQAEYQNAAFDPLHLTMLGVKSTVKDRWRQILSEAARIAEKHLFTLEPSISVNQTAQMKASSVTLVIPAPLHKTFQESQRAELVALSDFIGMVRSRQQGA